MTDDDGSVLVTKADRDAAFNTGVRLSKSEWLTLYEAFARHREKVIEAQAAEIERLEKKISELLIAGNGLNGYAGHDDNCSRNNILPVCEPCTCGFSDIRKAWQSWSAALEKRND
jgi:hypothetical protein